MPIPNNYKGKKPNEVWGEWNAEQKKHFLHDHFYSLGKSIPEGVYQLEWDNLPTPISIEISKHIDMEQYKNGGSVGKIKNMSLGMPVTYRGELYEITQKDGITHLTLNKEGAWGSNYPTIPLSRIDQSELKDINNNKVSIPYTFFKNGGGVKNYKVGDNVSEGNKVKYKKGDIIRYQLEYSASPMLATSKAEKSANIHTGKIAKVSKKLGGYVYTLTSGLEVSEHEVKGKIPKAQYEKGGGIGLTKGDIVGNTVQGFNFEVVDVQDGLHGLKVKDIKTGRIFNTTFENMRKRGSDKYVQEKTYAKGGGVGELKGKTNKEISDMYWQMAENIEEEIHSDRGGETTGLNFERLEKLEKEMNKYRELAIKYDNKKYAKGGGVGNIKIGDKVSYENKFTGVTFKGEVIEIDSDGKYVTVRNTIRNIDYLPIHELKKMSKGGGVGKEIIVETYKGKVKYTNQDIQEMIEQINMYMNADNLPRWIYETGLSGHPYFPKNKKQVLQELNKIKNSKNDVYINISSKEPFYKRIIKYAKGGGVGNIQIGDNVHIPAENKTGYVTNVIANGKHYSVKFVDGTKNVYDKDEIEKIKEYAKGGGVGDEIKIGDRVRFKKEGQYGERLYDGSFRVRDKGKKASGFNGGYLLSNRDFEVGARKSEIEKYAKGGGVGELKWVKRGDMYFANGKNKYDIVKGLNSYTLNVNGKAKSKGGLNVMKSVAIDLEKVKMANGGNLPDKYITIRNMTPKEVWDKWTEKQKYHFLSDHFPKVGSIKTKQLAEYDYDELNFDIKEAIEKHVTQDKRYNTGGGVGSSFEYTIGGL